MREGQPAFPRSFPAELIPRFIVVYQLMIAKKPHSNHGNKKGRKQISWTLSFKQCTDYLDAGALDRYSRPFCKTSAIFWTFSPEIPLYFISCADLAFLFLVFLTLIQKDKMNRIYWLKNSVPLKNTFEFLVLLSLLAIAMSNVELQETSFRQGI